MSDDNQREAGVLQQVGNALGAAFRAVMRGGEIQAAGRQGIDELGQALKAFPDSIQAHAEPGGMFEPLHRDIAAARDSYAPEQPLPSPSQISRGDGKAAATVHGPAQQAEKSWTPSEISKDRGGKLWTDHITEREKGNQDGNAGNDQNERGRERSLADEQREQDKGRGR